MLSLDTVTLASVNTTSIVLLSHGTPPNKPFGPFRCNNYISLLRQGAGYDVVGRVGSRVGSSRLRIIYRVVSTVPVRSKYQ